MRASFPTEFDAVILGKSREAGSFDTPEGEVKFGDAYELSFVSSDGLAQTCRVPVKQFDDAADFDIAKQPPYTAIRVVGDVQVSDKGGYLRLTSARLAKDSAKAA